MFKFIIIKNILIIFFILERIIYYDAYTKSEFIFYTYIITWTDNILAFTIIINIIGYNSYSDCRFYNIQEI